MIAAAEIVLSVLLLAILAIIPAAMVAGYWWLLEPRRKRMARGFEVLFQPQVQPKIVALHRPEEEVR